MIENSTNSENKYDSKNLNLDFLYEGESRVYLNNWFFEEFLGHRNLRFFSFLFLSFSYCIHDLSHIWFDIMHFSLEEFIFEADLIEFELEYKSHRIEKEWHIEDCIGHRDDLPCYRHRDEVTESDGRGRDDGEVESIEITLTDRISVLESVYEKGSDDPTSEKNESYLKESSVVNMEHILEKRYRYYSRQSRRVLIESINCFSRTNAASS